MTRRVLAGFGGMAVAAWLAVCAAPADNLHFVLLGDRTGDVQPGVYERVWRALAATQPAFVLAVGDTVQGGDDATAEAEWREARRMLEPYRRIPLYLAPGNHDIWSEASERLFRQYAGRATHFGFDSGGAHFTVVDNSRSDAWPEGELAWLESDLREHAAAPVKFVVSHRPSWLLDAALGSPNGPLHRLAKRYGVCCVVAGHVHQLIHAELEGVTYLALPSAGAHLRLNARYEDGWFFGWTGVEVRGREVTFQVHALDGATTPLKAWGRAGLLVR
ncbi:MAG: metallophosphoesterase [Candidatus Solibacter sp.]|nr:metallophosphoesterase [Candidatus Solibacter sp.]